MTTKSKAVKILEEIVGEELSFASALKSERQCRQMTQEEFGDLLGVKKSYVCDLEKGRTNVSIAQAVEIARALNLLPKTFIKLALNQQLRQAGIDDLNIEINEKVS